MDYIDTVHKARKPHRCYMCGCEIEVGTKYIRQFVPEYKSAIRMHKECQELLSHEGFYDEESCEGTSDPRTSKEWFAKMRKMRDDFENSIKEENEKIKAS